MRDLIQVNNIAATFDASPLRMVTPTTAMALVLVMAVCARKRAREDDDLTRTKRRRCCNDQNRGLLRRAVTIELQNLPDPFFARMFRMPLLQFGWLVQATTPHFRMKWTDQSSLMAVLSSGSEVRFVANFAFTLLSHAFVIYPAGEPVFDCCVDHSVVGRWQHL